LIFDLLKNFTAGLFKLTDHQHHLQRRVTVSYCNSE